jgi:HAD superfamily hydrolase (TIGR01509 family)
MSTTGILFDFNGVIVDDEPQHCDALIATLAEYGYPLDRDTYYRDYLGFDDRECFRFTFARGGAPVDEARLQEAIERKNAHYERAIRGSMQLVPGAAEFIEEAALDGHQLGVVSGALRREIELVLSLAELRPHFAEIVAAEDVAACKPDPQGYLQALARLELEPRRCVVVEDSLPGLAAARAAGLRCAVLTTSHPTDAFTDADLVWSDFAGRCPGELPWSHA